MNDLDLIYFELFSLLAHTTAMQKMKEVKHALLEGVYSIVATN